MRRLTFFALFSLILVVPVQGQEVDDVRRIIERHNADLERWYAAGQIDSVASVFAEDAWQMPPNSPALVGREAIRGYWNRAVEWGEWEFTLETRSVSVRGPMAVERGRYVLSFSPGPDAPPGMAAFDDHGNYLVHWRLEEDGEWRIVADAPVSEVPLGEGTSGEGQAVAPASDQAEEAEPMVISAGEGHVGVSPLGVQSRSLAGSVTNGASRLYVGTVIFPPGHETPMHLHEIDEEVVYVLHGELTATLGDEEYTAGPGSTVFIPPGTWMKLENRTETSAVALGVLSRGEVEECVRVLFSTDATDTARREARKLCRIEARAEPGDG